MLKAKLAFWTVLVTISQGVYGSSPPVVVSTSGCAPWVYGGDPTNLPGPLFESNGIRGPMAQLGSKLYFSAYDPLYGVELHVLDGTSTSMVKDLNPGAGSAFRNWGKAEFIVFKGKLIFPANNGSHTLLYELDPSTDVVSALLGAYDEVWWDTNLKGRMLEFNDKLYFQAKTDLQGEELHVYDGTNPPVLAFDIQPGTDSSTPTYLTIFNLKLYFNADTAAFGAELYVYDGTNAPTLVYDIKATSGQGSNPRHFIVFKDKLFFQANDGSTGKEVWVYDGTNTPTLLLDIRSGSGSASPEGFTEFKGQLYWNAYDTTHGKELWKYDGTNTPVLDDIRPGQSSSDPKDFIVFPPTGTDSKLYFMANIGTPSANSWERELWMYDGVSVYTLVLDYVNDDSMMDANMSGYDFAGGVQCNELWAIPGQNSKWYEVKRTYPLVFNNQLYFNGIASYPAPPSAPPSAPTPSEPPSAPQVLPSLNNSNLQCWWDCNEQGGACPAFCGSEGACCRAGHDTSDEACGFGAAGCQDKHCCVLPIPRNESALNNTDADCWNECNQQGGACPSFCGSEGACCKAGYDTTSEACGFGTLGDEEHHKCVFAKDDDTLKKDDQECWWDCNEQGGACTSFCGSMGACCKASYDTSSEACAFGALGCDSNHCCVAQTNPLKPAQDIIGQLTPVQKQAMHNWLSQLLNA